MITVEKFLCCCELESALIFIAWADIICIVIGILGYLALYVKFLLQGCSDEVVQILKDMQINDCVAFTSGATVAVALITLISLGIIVVNYLLIRGAKTRNHKFLLPAMIISPIAITITAILYVSSQNTILIVTSVFLVIAGIYLWICLYSLYVRFRDETRTFDNVQYQPA